MGTVLPIKAFPNWLFWRVENMDLPIKPKPRSLQLGWGSAPTLAEGLEPSLGCRRSNRREWEHEAPRRPVASMINTTTHSHRPSIISLVLPESGPKYMSPDYAWGLWNSLGPDFEWVLISPQSPEFSKVKVPKRKSLEMRKSRWKDRHWPFYLGKISVRLAKDKVAR